MTTAAMTRGLSSPATGGSAILGVGSWSPQRVVTNDELAGYLDTSDEWIRQRVGIIERRFAAETESLIDMAVKAGTAALSHAGVEPSEVEVVIVPNCTMTAQIPNAAARVADRIGTSAAAFDLNAGCAGFCHGLAIASDLVRTGSARKALVIGAEKLTNVIDPSDRTTAIIFGDGAGAALVGQSEFVRIGPVVWGSDGSQADALMIRDRYVEMNGKAVFQWSIQQMPGVAMRALERAGLRLEQVDVVVPHQANLRIIQAVATALKSKGLRDDVVVAEDIKFSGNTSSASIPIALDHLRQEGRVRSGDVVLTVTVGAGLTFAAQALIWP